MKTYRQDAAYSHSGETKRLSSLLWFLGAAVAIGSILLVASARAGVTPIPSVSPADAALSPTSFERVDLTLRADQLPAEDFARLRERREAIDVALASGTRLLRSWDSREVLVETIRILESHGADLGENAIINFVSMEFTAPKAARDTLAALPFVRQIDTPSKPIPASFPDLYYDSEMGGLPPAGLDFYRSREQGHRGDDITVAIIDTEWGLLDTIPTLEPGQLPVVPADNRFKQKQASGSEFFEGILGNVHNMGTREHGTAVLETISEIAPDAEFLLFGIKGIAGIPAAIIDATDRGANIIAVALSSMETMSDPVAIEDGGSNRFTTAIDYATANATMVIVSAGNEAMRSYQDVFRPCESCVNIDDPDNDDGICLDASDDTNFHTFESDPTFEIPLLRALETSYDFEWGYYDVPSFDVTCMTAIEEKDGVNANDYKFRIYRVSWDGPPCDNDLNNPCEYPPVCPSDRSSDGATLPKNMGATASFQASFETDEEYTIGIYRSVTADPNVFPEFRVMCAPGLEFDMFDIDRDESQPNSLADIAVVANAFTIGAGDVIGVTEYSSRGPTADLALIKPEISGPFDVQNYTADYAFFDSGTLQGTSAAVAHTAGVAAVVQGKRLADGLALLSATELKQTMIDAALSQADEAGVDAHSGYGFLQMPAGVVDPEWTPGPTPGPTPQPTPTPEPMTCGNDVVEPSAGEECDDGNDINGDGCDVNCTVSRCGNGEVFGDPSSNSGAFLDGALYRFFGSGLSDPEYEQCDDGNLTDGDGCDSNCTRTACGNGVVTAGEVCDDGNLEDGDGCSSNCLSDESCGNGIHDSIAGEECDDGDADNGDGCDINCTTSRCGNGAVYAPPESGFLGMPRSLLGGYEECDDGNNIDNDGCDSNCTLPGCGNGIQNPDEACDDGNLNDGDCCSDSCAIEGSGTVCRESSDACDLVEYCDGQASQCPDDQWSPDEDQDSVCDLIDDCPSDFDPDQLDSDGDGAGDVCDLCTGGAISLRPLLKATNFVTDGADDKLKYKTTLLFDEAVTIQPHIDGFALQVLDAEGDAFVDLDLPAGLYNPLTRTGWIPTPNGRKFQFQTRGTFGEMEPKVILKWTPKKANQVIVIVKGKFGTFADATPAFPLTAAISLTPHDLQSGLCGEVNFPGPKPAPYCRFNGKQTALTCK